MNHGIVIRSKGFRSAVTPVIVAALLYGCSGRQPLGASAMNASYEAALERTAVMAVAEPPGDAGAQRAIGRAEKFFASMRPQTVREQARETYAAQAYLNDNVAVVEGAAAIGDYFAHTLEGARSIQVDFLDITHTGSEYFVRWRMAVVSDRLNDGAPMVSFGMTHFRFDAEGRILLHKDFWDASTGLYEYLPVLGPLLRQVRARAQGD